MVMVMVMVVIIVAAVIGIISVVLVVVMPVAGYVWIAAVAGVTAEVRVAWETAHVEVTDVADVTAPYR